MLLSLTGLPRCVESNFLSLREGVDVKCQQHSPEYAGRSRTLNPTEAFAKFVAYHMCKDVETGGDVELLMSDWQESLRSFRNSELPAGSLSLTGEAVFNSLLELVEADLRSRKSVPQSVSREERREELWG